MKISLVIPAWNERGRIERTVQGIERLRQEFPGEIEVLLVDDGSEDGTAEAAELLGLRVLRCPHRGKGAAIRAGMLAVQGDYRLQADADWSMPPEQFLRMLPPRLQDFDLAYATREHIDSRRHGEPLWRHLLGRAWNRVVQGLVLPGIEDSQCGFKCFRGEVVEGLFRGCQEDGWAADVEVLARAGQQGLRLVEIPIDWTYDPDSRVRLLRDVPAMLGTALRIRRRGRKMDVRSGG
jgi:glycosyltransferase involved in cell wall biosynthesis